MSRALQRGQPACQPHDEQRSESANPRRLMNTRRLLAAIEPRRERRHERRADAFDGRWRRGCRRTGSRAAAPATHRAPRQLEPAIAAALRVNQRLERRRCAAEHHGDVALARAPDGDVAAVIANALLLLERRVVLFVDDDEPEPGQRREDGESRTEDEIRVAGRRRAPVAQALAGRKPAVQRDRSDGSARHRRMRWPNCGVRLISGTRIEHLPAGGDALGGGSQVHLRLAAPGDALQQEGRERSGGVD
mgnify:CR=1 FL=1